MAILRETGSFRDPSGFVFYREGRVFRAVDNVCHGLLAELEGQGRFAELVEKDLIVLTNFVREGALLDQLRNECPQAEHFLEHRRINTITYPYEWSLSMLADAGIHTLDLQIELLQDGCALKDATPYNIQFENGRPQMIDVASIERPKRLDVWFAMGQFLQTFLYPLLLCRYRGWDLRSYFLGSLGGRSIDQVARSFGWLARLRPGLLLDLTLPWWLHRWAEGGQRARRDLLEKRVTNAEPQVLNLNRLRGKLARLAAGHRPRGVWSEYTRICNYRQEADAAKKTAIREYLKSVTPRSVLDLGCNTGDYSYLAAETGAQVLAADSDHDAVEVLYRKLRQSPAAITPLVIDLANPSPPIGYMNAERASFLERGKSDCVFALALLHHLLVNGNMSLAGARDLLWSVTDRDLVLEFVPTDDEMFQKLMGYRVNLFDHVTLANCRTVMGERFNLLREFSLPDSKRTLLFLRKK